MCKCEHDQLMNEVTCAGAARDSRWQCVDCDDGRGNGIWFVFAPEDAVVLPADVVAQVVEFLQTRFNRHTRDCHNNRAMADTPEQEAHCYCDHDTAAALLALLPKP